ncbi:helix-turn-helix transcriptional regulator [Shewanella sp. A3A]|uniref:Helix-turn-helix transcriptional regulator n=1 Tax=Shewanella electrica TaxID=515560 RepID=A0ABT2FJE1_9GAMM|nr:helix-turn-helix transcriptional regulator [Shewanella electrica]MCH1918967.1 helix-turn-helix transcriptional regulator [Shewanella ferrihydritica]MCH1923234.1 helix-turn-helix transcriptional regulator [Shewanella electrica]MCS4555331.1 helix-turn-helix transcriptional regulator [Shewanella electrica]
MASATDNRAMHIGHAIRVLRIQRKLTQEQLALDADIATSNVSRIENGLRQPSQKLLRKIAYALETTPSSLYAACENGIVIDTSLKDERINHDHVIASAETQILLKLFSELTPDNKKLLVEQTRLLHRWQQGKV